MRCLIPVSYLFSLVYYQDWKKGRITVTGSKYSKSTHQTVNHKYSSLKPYMQVKLHLRAVSIFPYLSKKTNKHVPVNINYYMKYSFEFYQLLTKSETFFVLFYCCVRSKLALVHVCAMLYAVFTVKIRIYYIFLFTSANNWCFHLIWFFKKVFFFS